MPNREGQRSLTNLLADAFAVSLSWILNPLIIPGAVYAILLYQFGATRNGILHGVGIGLLIFAVIPGLGIIWLRKKGVIDSFDIRTKEKRVKPMLLGLSCNVIALIVIARADFPAQPVIMASTIAFLIVGLVVFIVTKYWKISIHLSTYAALIVALITSTGLWGELNETWPDLLFGPYGNRSFSEPIIFLIASGAALLSWARVRCKVHSIAQVGLGFILGAVTHIMAYWALTIWLN